MSLALPRFAIYLIVSLAALLAGTAAEAKRLALIIGNGAYQHVPRLANPANDAIDMSAALKKLGFEIIEGRDLDEAAMRRAVKQFAETLTGAKIGLFFYAGHGLQVDGQNYLVPIDAKLETAAGLDFELIRLDVVQRAMERETRTNVIFLDACRDNPLTRNLARVMGTRSVKEVGRGLAAVELGVGTLISFSTQPGNFALDGDGRNSPYAAALAKHLSNPTEDLSTLLISVRNDVMAATNDRQIPWEHSALRSKFYFGAVPESKPAGPTLEQQREFWQSIRGNADPAVLATYLERNPNGPFAALARALIEEHEHKLRAEAAVREEERLRKEEAAAAAEVKRLQDEERRARQAALEIEQKRAEETKRFEAARTEALKEAALEEQRKLEAEREIAEAKRLQAERERTLALNKALEDARLAREAAEAGRRERAAALRAEEKAKESTRKEKAAAKVVEQRPAAKAKPAMCRQGNFVLPCERAKDGWATRLD